MPAPTNLIFPGYKSIVNDFWGLTEYNIPASPWNNRNVLMVDLSDEKVKVELPRTVHNHQEAVVFISGEPFLSYLLVGDGGFLVALIDAEDYDRLVEVYPDHSYIIARR